MYGYQSINIDLNFVKNALKFKEFVEKKSFKSNANRATLYFSEDLKYGKWIYFFIITKKKTLKHKINLK